MINIEIDQKKLKDIISRVDKKHIGEMTRGLIGDLAQAGKSIATEKLKPEDSMRGTDYAQKSMRYKATDLQATVYSVMPEARAMSIETGRSPGETVGIKSLARWYDGNLYLSNISLRDRKDLRQTAHNIQDSIKRSGAKAKRFISGAWESLNSGMPVRLERLARSIEKRWSD